MVVLWPVVFLMVGVRVSLALVVGVQGIWVPMVGVLVVLALMWVFLMVVIFHG